MNASLRIVLSTVLFLIPLTTVYILWAIQPQPTDDWLIYPVKFFIPEAGQEWRHMIAELFLVNPISLFKPSILITDILVVGMGWVLLKNEHMVVRVMVSFLLAVGFPYLGTVGPWGIASGEYGLSTAEMMLWFLFYITFKDRDQFIVSITFFILTFLTCISHEVWLLAFSWIVLYVVLEAGKIKSKRKIVNAVLISLGYVLAIVYYMKGGPKQIIDQRANSPGLFVSVFTLKNVLVTLVHGTKENLLLLKDCVPVFLLIAYVKGRSSFKNLESRIFIFLLVGIIFFIYINFFLIGAPQWRCRWLCACGLTLVFLSMPLNFPQDLRRACLGVACVWFLYNGIFTYYHTTIDVKGWLKYRSDVVRHDPKVLEENPYWGKQDNKYRYFWPPTIQDIRPRVLEYWKDH